jgi:saccharopine dehydrogenase (NAD+, L-lysine-forming)
MKARIGIVKESKNPPDKRVPITPVQVDIIEELFPNVKVVVQDSKKRCFKDDEYEYLQIPLSKDVSDCDILLGVKEVMPDKLLANKTYMFFSHVGKKQPYNRNLLKTILNKNITLIDYEYLTRPNGSRIVAFGYWAGVVGAYNALRARGDSTNSFSLKPAYKCHDLDEMYAGLRKIALKPLKILITGGGRVASGALETLGALKIRTVTYKEYLNHNFDEPVVCQIEPMHYVKRKDGVPFEIQHFFANPEMYESAFKPYQKVTDIYISCHFWDPKSPKFIEKDDFKDPDFKISVIADVSCDINGPIASTIRASNIEEPYYDYNPQTGMEEPAFSKESNITVMAVDNLPGELPRNASRDFGRDLIKHVFPALFANDDDGIIERATIAKGGKLTPKFAYLQDYVDDKE